MSIDAALVSIERGDAKGAAQSLLRVIKKDPKNVEAYNILGTVYAKDQPQRALRCFQRAIELKPDFAIAVYNLANINKSLGNLKIAIGQYLRAIELDPSIYQAYFNIGSIFLELFNYTEGCRFLQKALSIKPDYAQALLNLGVCNFNRGLVSEAISCYERAIKADPEYADAHFNLALALLMLGDYKRGWDEYRWRWKSSQFKANIYEGPFWDGSDIAGKRLLVFTEQGYGDTIQFVRYIRLLIRKGIHVMLQCPEALKVLIDKSFNHINVTLTDKEPSKDQYDQCCPLMELPFLLKTTLEDIPRDIPYLVPDRAVVEKYRSIIDKLLSIRGIGARLKVGIAWRGSKTNYRGQYRSVNTEEIVPLLRTESVVFVSLMKESPFELEGSGVEVLDLSQDLTDFHETAGLIANLDLVISIDTAVAHLSGAMGKDVWLMLHYTSDWRWMLNRADSPWYPTMRIFRQEMPDDWHGVITRVTDELISYSSCRCKQGQGVKDAAGLYRDALRLRDAQMDKEAIGLLREAVRIKPDYAEAHFDLALLLLKKHNFKEGWVEYEWRNRLCQCKDCYPELPIAPWRGEGLQDKTILIYDEQGFGDAIQFIRFTYRLITEGAGVYLLCRPELTRLMRTFKGLRGIFQRGIDFSVKVDYICSLMGLPLNLKVGIEDVHYMNPYFDINEGDIKRWRNKAGFDPSAINTGLAWRGKASHINNHNRSMDIDNLMPLLNLSGLSFYSLQKQERKVDLSTYKIKDYTEEFCDFYDTACFIANLDLVITVDTAVAHLAGAMGKETWLMLPHNAEWRWFEDEHSTPWYPTMRLFRQPTLGDWASVINSITNRIDGLRQ